MFGVSPHIIGSSFFQQSNGWHAVQVQSSVCHTMSSLLLIFQTEDEDVLIFYNSILCSLYSFLNKKVILVLCKVQRIRNKNIKIA